MSTRDEYVRKMHAYLDQWNAEIDTLAAKAESAGSEVRAELNKRIEELRARQDDARARLETLRNAGDDAWHDLRAGIEMAWDAIGEALDSARSRFGK